MDASAMKLIDDATKLACHALLCMAAIFTLAGCASDPDEEGIPPKYKPKKMRDPVEQRVFYDGWGER